MSTTDHPTPAEAEAGAEQARAGLIGTLNQLRENLKPSNVVDEVMTSAKVSASAISEQIWDTARRNPLPALMIGAGLAMIFGFGGRAVSQGGRARSAAGTRLSRAAQNQPGGPEFAAHISRAPGSVNARRDGSITESAAAALGSVRDRTSDLLGSANDRLTAAAQRGATALGGTLRSTTQEGISMKSYTRTRDQVTSTLSKTLEEQPLILAAIGLAVGAALGAAIPQTETENSLLGETSGSVRNAAQEMVEEQYSQLKSAAGHAVEEIKQTVAEHGVSTDNLSGLVHDVTEKAKAATYEAGKTLDPTA